MIEELKNIKYFCVRIYYQREEINEIVTENGIELTYDEPEVIQGWVGRPKGMLQVLWERGYVNTNELEKYSGDEKKVRKTDLEK